MSPYRASPGAQAATLTQTRAYVPPGHRTWKRGEVSEDVVQWKANNLTLTVSRGEEKKRKPSVGRNWNPHDHPRDRDGKFVPVGSAVTVHGRGGGTVEGGTPDGRVRVRLDSDDKVYAIPRGYVRANPSGASKAKPATANGAAPASELTDEQYDDYVTNLRNRLDTALKAGMSTDKLHTKGGDGKTYTPERARQHKQIVDDLMVQYANVPAQGKALLSGGLGGAGKTTVLGKYAGVKDSDYATLNVDDAKEIMAARGMVPKVEGVSPMEAATLIHEESGHIVNLLAERLYAEKKNVIWDITMASEASTRKRVEDLNKHGYTEIKSVFVEIPVEESVSRALARHRRGMENYRAGKGHGGRFVPPEVIRSNKVEGWSSKNRRSFESLKDELSGWVMFDNSVRGRAPELLDVDGWYDNPAEERVAALEAQLRQVRSQPAADTDPRLLAIERDLESQLAGARADRRQ